MKRKPENYINSACLFCKEEFKVHISQINRGQGKYCSRSCARKGSPTRKKEKSTVICHFCNTVFEKYKSEIKKNVRNLHFCSSKCWYSYNQRENHYLWSGGQNERMCPEYSKWKKAVHKRDKYFCRNCLSRNKLEAHHILPFAKYKENRWDVNNGITLCHDCHIKTYGKEENYSNILNFIASRPTRILLIEDEEIINPETLYDFFINCAPNEN